MLHLSDSANPFSPTAGVDPAAIQPKPQSKPESPAQDASYALPPLPEGIDEVIAWFAERDIDIFALKNTPWPANAPVRPQVVQYSNEKSTFLQKNGKVRRAYIPSFLTDVVIKFLDDDDKGLKTPLKQMPNRKKYSSFRLESLDVEVTSMRSGQTHPNVLRLHGALIHIEFSPKLRKWTLQCGLVMELASRGDYWDFWSSVITLSWQKAGFVTGVNRLPAPAFESQLAPVLVHHLKQTCSALTYFHRVKGIAHRDIKLENIFVTEDMVAKLADFGHGWGLGKEDELSWGTSIYRCPLSGKDYEKADIYTIGCVILGALSRMCFDTEKCDDLFDLASEEEEGGFAPVTMDAFYELPAMTPFVQRMLALAEDCVTVPIAHRPSAPKILEKLEQIERSFEDGCTAKKGLEFVGELLKAGRGYNWDKNTKTLKVRSCTTVEETMTYFLTGVRRVRRELHGPDHFQIVLTGTDGVELYSGVVVAENDTTDVVTASLVGKIFESSKISPYTWLRVASRKGGSELNPEVKLERLLRNLDISSNTKQKVPSSKEQAPLSAITRKIADCYRAADLEGSLPKGAKEIPYYTIQDLRFGAQRKLPHLLLWKEWDDADVENLGA